MINRIYTLYIVLLLTCYVSSCLVVCDEYYYSLNEDSICEIDVLVESTGYLDQWVLEQKCASISIHPDEQKYYFIGIDLYQESCPDTCFSPLEVFFHFNENGEMIDTYVTYDIDISCSPNEGDHEFIDWEDIQGNCYASFIWTTEDISIHIDGCTIVNGSPDTSGRPVVTAVTISGDYYAKTEKGACY